MRRGESVSRAIWDLVVDTLHDDVLEATVATLGAGRVLRDPKDPDEPLLIGEEGFLVVRIWGRDPVAYAREVQRRVWGLRVVSTFERKAIEKEDRDGD